MNIFTSQIICLMTRATILLFFTFNLYSIIPKTKHHLCSIPQYNLLFVRYKVLKSHKYQKAMFSNFNCQNANSEPWSRNQRLQHKKINVITTKTLKNLVNHLLVYYGANYATKKVSFSKSYSVASHQSSQSLMKGLESQELVKLTVPLSKAFFYL